MLPRCVVKQPDVERELAVERHLVTAACVELRSNVVRLERQVCTRLDQRVPGARRAGRSRGHAAILLMVSQPGRARSPTVRVFARMPTDTASLSASLARSRRAAGSRRGCRRLPAITNARRRIVRLRLARVESPCRPCGASYPRSSRSSAAPAGRGTSRPASRRPRRRVPVNRWRPCSRPSPRARP